MIKLWEVWMHNISISFLFLVFRDTIVANKAVKPPFSPLICNTMTFDTQRCHEIGIPRDLLLKTALKVQPFSFFFSSTTFSDGLPFRNSKKYDMSLCLSHMMVDRSSLCYFWSSDFFFCKEIIFFTKYRIQSHVICGFLLLCCFSGRRRKCEILSLIESLSFTYTANVIFKLRISQNKKWEDKNSSETLLWVKKNCLKLLIYV